MFETLLAGAMADPVKSLLGSGGILGAVLLFVRWLRARPKVAGRYVGETFDTKINPTIEVVIRVELENHGRENTSFKLTASLRCRTAKRESQNLIFVIQDTDRTLQPVTPRTIALKAIVPASYAFSHFRVLTIRFSRGHAVRIRVLNASGQCAGAVRFAALEWCFRLFGALPHVRG